MNVERNDKLVNAKAEQVAMLFEEIKDLDLQLAEPLKSIVNEGWKTTELRLLRSAESKLDLIVEKYVQVLALMSNSISLRDYPKELVEPMVRAKTALMCLNKYIKVRKQLRLVK
jgi:hypothetical protein